MYIAIVHRCRQQQSLSTLSIMDTNDVSDRKEGHSCLLNLAANLSEHIGFAIVSQILSQFERPSLASSISAYQRVISQRSTLMILSSSICGARSPAVMARYSIMNSLHACMYLDRAHAPSPPLCRLTHGQILLRLHLLAGASVLIVVVLLYSWCLAAQRGADKCGTPCCI